MTTFDEREQAFENQYQHDQDMLFRIRARRGRLAGLWAAELLGLAGAEADAYARQLVDADIVTLGAHDIRDRLVEDLNARGVSMSAHRVERELDRLGQVARQQVIAG